MPCHETLPTKALYIARLIVIAGFPPGTINILSADWVTVKSAFYDSTGKAYPSVTLVDTVSAIELGKMSNLLINHRILIILLVTLTLCVNFLLIIISLTFVSL